MHIQEYPTGYDKMVLHSTPELLGQDVVEGKFIIERGFMRQIEKPGPGIELKDNAEVIRPPITRVASMWAHFEGGMVDQ